MVGTACQGLVVIPFKYDFGALALTSAILALDNSFGQTGFCLIWYELSSVVAYFLAPQWSFCLLQALLFTMLRVGVAQ